MGFNIPRSLTKGKSSSSTIASSRSSSSSKKSAASSPPKSSDELLDMYSDYMLEGWPTPSANSEPLQDDDYQTVTLITPQAANGYDIIASPSVEEFMADYKVDDFGAAERMMENTRGGLSEIDMYGANVETRRAGGASGKKQRAGKVSASPGADAEIIFDVEDSGFCANEDEADAAPVVTLDMDGVADQFRRMGVSFRDVTDEPTSKSFLGQRSPSPQMECFGEQFAVEELGLFVTLAGDGSSTGSDCSSTRFDSDCEEVCEADLLCFETEEMEEMEVQDADGTVKVEMGEVEAAVQALLGPKKVEEESWEHINLHDVDEKKPFLPGNEHLSNLVARPTFITYDREIDSSSSGNKNDSDTNLPGEHFEIADDGEKSDTSHEMQPTPPTVFEALDECADADMFSEADSDKSEADWINSARGVTIFDADTQQEVKYTALNELTTVVDSELLPRIHRAEDDDFLADKASIREINEPIDECYEDSADEWSSISLEDPRNDEDLTYWPMELNPATQNSRPHLWVETDLTTVTEQSDSKKSATNRSPASSNGSLDFEDDRGFIKPLSERRLGFLDDEFSPVREDHRLKISNSLDSKSSTKSLKELVADKSEVSGDQIHEVIVEAMKEFTSDYIGHLREGDFAHMSSVCENIIEDWEINSDNPSGIPEKTLGDFANLVLDAHACLRPVSDKSQAKSLDALDHIAARIQKSIALVEPKLLHVDRTPLIANKLWNAAFDCMEQIEDANDELSQGDALYAGGFAATNRLIWCDFVSHMHGAFAPAEAGAEAQTEPSVMLSVDSFVNDGLHWWAMKVRQRSLRVRCGRGV
ncbi:hypothetical protein BDV95DRAFT_118212 [Massariosphaeria phaeospora]|uniref:Uncharacterized protein n=1 Tax=Massariosphaeria phaeospora TaxID=100035 RepID=A0A7C8M6B7_9PLEO|nr:hypothetical protein BDV95DRAFT_118212 [Massariosphaeria phaeospora]